MKGDGDPIDVLEIGERVSLILHLHGSVNISRNFRRLLILIETFSLFFIFFLFYQTEKEDLGTENEPAWSIKDIDMNQWPRTLATLALPNFYGPKRNPSYPGNGQFLWAY